MSARPPVIVVGGGLAGLSASFAALRAGSAVVLLERETKPGGNSIKASSGISAAPTRYQAGPGPDTQFFSDSIRSVGWRLNDEGKLHREKLVSRLTNQSSAALDFLVDEIGVELSVVSLLGGHSVPRTHRGSGKIPPGFAIVSAVLERLKKDERFELRTGHEVTRVLSAARKHNGDVTTSVTGVEVVHEGKSTIMNGPVIFTTGGFAGDANGLLAKYRPDLAGYPSTNSPIPGMHQLLTAAGAQLVDMDSVQIHPTGFVNPAHPNEWSKILAAEMLRGEGGILLYKGRRFVNEVATREYVSKAMMGLPAEEKSLSSDSGSIHQWNIQLLLDPGAAARSMNHIGFYAAKGLLVKKAIRDLDDETRATLREYSAIVAGSKQDEFGRQNFGNWALKAADEDDTAEVYIGQVTPTVHFTMGGVVIGEKGEVLASPIGAQQPAAIRGLWAAGEVTGGIHGNNRLGGSSLLECVVFGLMAGEQAGEFAKSH